MSDYLVQEAERIGNEMDAYNNWIEKNTEYIIEQYSLTDPEAPEDIYEGVLDDDYPDTYDRWIQDITIDDVPGDFISNMYDNAMEGPQ